MKELTTILKTRAERGEEIMALATVVQTEGSSYRRPGAHMLILPDGRTVGSVSGGCLEKHVVLKAQSIMETGKAELLTYDTTTEEDIVFGVGLGCKGVVHILVERVEPFSKNGSSSLLSFFQTIFERRETGVIATIIRGSDKVGGRAGDRLLLRADGTVATSVVCAEVQNHLLMDAREVQQTNHSKISSYELSNGKVEAFFEMIHSPAPLLVFGAGYDAIPMVRLAKELGFHVTVIDRRPAYATRERFPDADCVMLADGEGIPKKLRIDENASAVIMSHNYLTDLAFLKGLLPLPLRYLGLMGPRKRAEKMLAELQQEADLPEMQLLRLHNPVGLDIGAESPEQISLSILAEIQATAAGHAGGFLCEKKGPIHSPRHFPFDMPQPDTTRSKEKLPCLPSA
jgi:xanthine dehydrogenase accessory factor